jgi:hypothetical protein
LCTQETAGWPGARGDHRALLVNPLLDPLRGHETLMLRPLVFRSTSLAQVPRALALLHGSLLLWATGALADEKADFATIVKETGCNSRNGEATFAAKYKERLFIARGTITDIVDDNIALRILPTTKTYDIRVRLDTAHDAERVSVGDQINISFVMRTRAGCWWGYGGDHGVIHRPAEGDFRE